MSITTMNMDTSPISYTNKDFRAVYEELLNLVNSLTDRWDPKATNESDPGAVLLKLKAFIADKLNYNIDKNTLENFPSQATQRGNAQKAYDILGYGMKYYKSATTKVKMKYYNVNNDIDVTGLSTYEIPIFTQLTDDSNRVNYVTTSKAIISIGDNIPGVEVDVIEGVARNLTINGNNKITIDNLDSNYRLYITETMVAQNGIYINSSEDDEYWKAVDNLEATQLGQKVFKFGVLPNTSTCYLEFPQDAASLFGNGINVKYIITSGAEGNISAGVISTIANDINIDSGSGKPINVKNCTLISQLSSSTNGQDPESLQSAYRNCKKTINTFNTLVTTKDYENAIFNSGEVSNCVVSDRTNDIAKSYKIVTKTMDGESNIYLNSLNNDSLPTMNAFDIAIYALNPVESIDGADTFNKTFQTSSTTIKNAQDIISNYKSIQHNYLDTIAGGKLPFIYKNLVSLKGKFLTYQKVTQSEAEEIQSNINKNLYKNYNSRMVDFGQELNYDQLIKTIKESDDRIKIIILDYPEYVCKLMESGVGSNVNSSLIDLTNDEIKTDIIAKSILAGVTPYFIFNNNEKLDFTMTPVNGTPQGSTIDNNGVITISGEDGDGLTEESSQFGAKETPVAAITTSVILKKDATLKQNENVFCVGPSFVSKVKLSTCLYYELIAENNVEGKPRVIAPNDYYILGENEYLVVAEGLTSGGNLDISNNDKKSWIYGKGNIIHPTMSITASAESWNQNNPIASTEKQNLGTSNTIEILNENSIQINKNKTIYAVWSCENLNNKLFDTSNVEYLDEDYNFTNDVGKYKYVQLTTLLQNNDIFIYTDREYQDLIMLGSGTELKVIVPIAFSENIINYDWSMPKLDRDSLTTHGAQASIEWREIYSNLNFFTSEKQIIALGEGTTITWDNDNVTITNKIQSTSNFTNFKYKYDGDNTYRELPAIISGSGLDNENYMWEVFSRLSLTISPTIGQKLISDGYRTQAIAIYKATEDKNDILQYSLINGDTNAYKSILSNNHYITANNIVTLAGGIKQNTASLTSEGKFKSDLILYVSGKNDNYDTNSNAIMGSWSTTDDIQKSSIETEDYTQIFLSSNTPSNGSFNLTLPPKFLNSLTPIIFYSSYDSNEDCELTITSNTTNTNVYFEGYANNNNNTITNINGSNSKYARYIRINSTSSDISEIELTLNVKNLNGGATLTIYNPLKIEKENGFIVEDSKIKTKLQKLATPNSVNLFDFSHQIDEEDIIENPLNSESFFKSNHIFNKYVIPQLNTDDIDITISNQSIQSRRI